MSMSERQSLRTIVRKSSLGLLIAEMHYQLFNRDPQQRSQTENRQITRVIENCPFFTKETIDMLKRNQVFQKLLDAAKYEKIPANETIYHEGDPSEKFYIVLKGQVKLFVPRRQKNIDQDLEVKRGLPSEKTPCSNPSGSSSPSFAFTKVSSLNSPTHAQSPSSNLWYKTGKSGFSALSKAVSSTEGRKSITRERKLWFHRNDDSEESEGESPTDTRSPNGKAKLMARRGGGGAESGQAKLAISTSKDKKQIDQRINQEIDADDQLLLRLIGKWNKKYVVDDVCLYVLSKVISSGEALSEIHRKSSSRAETAVATMETHLLSLKIEDYLDIFEEPVKERKERLGLFQSLLEGHEFPERSILTFANKFKRQVFQLKDQTFQEGETPDGLYLITEGEIRLMKTETKEIEGTSHRLQRKISKQLEVAKLGPMQFFGCEDLLGFDKRQFTAEVATMSVSVLKLESVYINQSLYTMKPFLKFIAERARVQHDWESARLNHLIEVEKGVEEAKDRIKDMGSQPMNRSIQAFYQSKDILHIPLSMRGNSPVSPKNLANEASFKSSMYLKLLLKEKISTNNSPKANKTLQDSWQDSRKNSQQPDDQDQPENEKVTGKKIVEKAQSQSLFKSFISPRATGKNFTARKELNVSTGASDTDLGARTSLWKINQMRSLPQIKNRVLRRGYEPNPQELVQLYDSVDGHDKHYLNLTNISFSYRHSPAPTANSGLDARMKDQVSNGRSTPQAAKLNRTETTHLETPTPRHEDQKAISEDKLKEKLLQTPEKIEGKTSPLRATRHKLKPFLQGMDNYLQCTSDIRRNDESITEYLSKRMPATNKSELYSPTRYQSIIGTSRFAEVSKLRNRGIEENKEPSVSVFQLEGTGERRKLVGPANRQASNILRCVIPSKHSQFRLKPTNEVFVQSQYRKGSKMFMRSERFANVSPNASALGLQMRINESYNAS